VNGRPRDHIYTVPAVSAELSSFTAIFKQSNGRTPLVRIVRDGSPSQPCGRCKGHCMNSNECAGGLECCQKRRKGPSDETEIVPTCSGSDLPFPDQCTVTPDDNGEDDVDERVPLMPPTCECSPTNKCGICARDCDTDDNCKGKLIWYRKGKGLRGNFQVVVLGCYGQDVSKTDWCILPRSARRSCFVQGVCCVRTCARACTGEGRL